MKISHSLILHILAPILASTIIITLVTLIPLNNNKNKWENMTHSYVNNSLQEYTVTQVNYTSDFISTFFDQTNNDILLLASYIQKNINNELHIANNYENYYGVSSVNNQIPPTDVDGDSFFTTTYINGNDLLNINPYILNESTIYNNAFRAVYKSTNVYDILYFGFEENGFFRVYPFQSLDKYVNLSYNCYYNNQPKIGYDPRCRVWYDIAKNDDKIHYTAPYVSALKHLVLITASKRIMNGTDLIGVIGMNFYMDKIDNVILNNEFVKNGYTFMMDNTGTLVSYPNLNRIDGQVQTIFNMESSVNPAVWYSIINRQNSVVTSIEFTKNNEPWIAQFKYLSNVGYYFVLIYPQSSIMDLTSDIIKPIFNNITIGTIVMSFVLFGIIVINSLIINKVSSTYTKSVNQLYNDVKNINEANLDIETGNRAPVSAEFTSINKNFGNLLVAVKFGNESYYSGNLVKALESYNQAEKLMQTFKIIRGLSICYNNKANVLKQLQRFGEAEQLYYNSIKIVEDLLSTQKEKSKIMAYNTMISYRKMNLGVLYKDTNRLLKAKQMFEESLLLANQVENIIGISKISGNLGQLYLQMGEQYITQSEELFQRSLTISIQKQNDISIQYSKMNMGILEFHKKKYMEAGKWFSDIFENHKNIDFYVKEISLIKLEEILRLIGKTEEANNINKSYTQTKYISKNILFLLDNSGSMQGASINQCKKNIKDIILNKVDDSDIISLTTFNNQVRNIFFNLKKSNFEIMEKYIDSIAADAGTAFYDALYQNIQTPSKWIVALTDGEDNGSKYGYRDVIARLKIVKTNLIIITVGTLPNRLNIKSICDNASLNGFGLLVEISTNAQDIDKAFTKVSKILRGELHVESL